MTRRILVATDFSKNADAAWRFAIELGAGLNADLRLVHVAMSMPAAAPRKLRQDYERHFAVSQRLLEERAPAATARGVNVKTLVTTGDPAEVVAATAHDESIDLVVIGTHGHERAGEVLVGSVAERLLRLAPCTVIVVKPSPSSISAAA